MKNKLFKKYSILFFTITFLSFNQMIAQNYQTILTEIWVDNNWQNANLQNHTYDASNLLANIQSQDWNVTSSVWGNAQKQVITRDSNNNIAQIVYLQWNLVTLNWENSASSSMTYNANNKILTFIFQLWQNGNWINSSNFLCTYGNNQQISNLLLKNWNTNTNNWDISSRYDYNYNSNNKEELVVSQSFDNISNSWTNYQKFDYFYSQNNLTSVLTQNWNTSNWQNFALTSYEYDANQRQTIVLTKTWDLNLNLWLNNYLVNNTYLGNDNNINSSIFQLWNLAINQWENLQKLTFTYFTPNLATNLIIEEATILIFPNPTTDFLTVLATTEKESFKIIDLMGKVYSNGILSNEKTILSVENLPKGVYFFTTNTKSVKFIKN